jgi:L-iditol 2-dehydrogenase
MRALTKRSDVAGDVAVVERPVPGLGPGQALVRVTGVGLCGSDVHAIKAHPGYEWVAAPVTLGHEITGVVDAVAGDANPVLAGARVGVISMDGCRGCDLCDGGSRPLCPERTVIGLSFDGGAAELAAVRTDNLVRLPGDLSWQHAVLLEPCSVAVHAVARTPLPPGGRVIISGAGPVGMLTAFAARARGAQVTLVGVARDEAVRLPLLRRCGFDARSVLPSEPAGAWIEASGSVEALAAAVTGLRAGGELTAVGMYDRLSPLDASRVVRREITIRGSYGSVAQDYQTALGLLATADIPAQSMVSPFALDDWRAALDAIAQGTAIKAVLMPGSA